MNPSRWPQRKDAKECDTPADGWAWLWNKRTTPFNFTADGMLYTLPGHTAMYVPADRTPNGKDVARLAHKQSLERLHPDPRWSVAVRWPEGYGEPDDPDFGDTLDEPVGNNLYDFEQDPNPSTIPIPDGLTTHVVVKSVPGAAAALADRRFDPLTR